jgi:hypothetical protein
MTTWTLLGHAGSQCGMGLEVKLLRNLVRPFLQPARGELGTAEASDPKTLWSMKGLSSALYTPTTTNGSIYASPVGTRAKYVTGQIGQAASFSNTGNRGQPIGWAVQLQSGLEMVYSNAPQLVPRGLGQRGLQTLEHRSSRVNKS